MASDAAKNLCYFLMELVSGYILEIEVRDKCHVGLAFSNMEKQALQNALQQLHLSLNIVEVVTDASPSIKKLIAKTHKVNFKYMFAVYVSYLSKVSTVRSLHVYMNSNIAVQLLYTLADECTFLFFLLYKLHCSLRTSNI